MNPSSVKEAQVVFKSTITSAKGLKNVDVVVCPPFPYVNIKNDLKTKKVYLGAQNVSSESSGAYTGEVSASILSSSKVSHVIIGHSERRVMGETNSVVNKKIQQALKAKLAVVLCVGESVRDTHGEYLGFIKQQLHECLQSVSKAQMAHIIIAYEPIWAISSNGGREAIPDEFTEVRIFIRKILSDMYDAKCAHATKVLYGGSVGPEDVSGFLVEGGADGVLVGHNSLIPKKFAAILHICNTK